MVPQGWEWLIILVIFLLLFGGSRLAGLGKAAGQAVREFKEETQGISKDSGTDSKAENNETGGSDSPDQDQSSQPDQGQKPTAN